MSITVAVAMVKDEADIIESTVRRMATQVDAVMIADNDSSDGTWEILTGLKRKLPTPLVLRRDDEPAYHQAAKMSALAKQAADELDADWVVPFDADEVWYSQWGRVADVLAGVHETVCLATWWEHVPTVEDADTDDPVEWMRWRKQIPATFPKVAVRPYAPVSLLQGNHDATYPESRALALEVRHFPYRSAKQMHRKVRNGVEASNAAGHDPAHVLRHWRELLERIVIQGEQAVWSEMVYRHPSSTSLVEDPCPI